MSARVYASCLVAGALACAPVATAGPGCAPLGSSVVLTRELGETSGIAVGRQNPNVLWTHNDGDSDLYALDRDGRVLEQFDMPRLGDWEDIEIADCPGAASCLYLADTGDNAEARAPGRSRILRLAEPEVGSDQAVQVVDIFPVRFPDGPRDVEALFVLPGEVPYLVTKGGGGAVTVYRYPPPLRPDTVTLVEVQRLTDGSVPLLDRVTGASASPDGSWVAVRTYQALRFYRTRADSLVATDGGLTNLRTLREIQGEGVGIGPDGLVVLSSEGGPLGGPPSLTLLRCRLAAS
ncbi:MAG: hypothetical protein OEN00_04435 [Gemmatimonadota bacterium]|nr:hypothetical protein [Gemmatimonadota bacterium]